jgi:hypothetical protein
MKKLFTLLLLMGAGGAYGQLPLYYQSNFVRIVQPNDKQKMDTLVNPYTGGLNNPTFYKIDLNGDGVQDLFVFERDVNENQFLNFTASGKKSVQYHFTPKYESAFPNDMLSWVGLTDYNKDGLPDIFTHSRINSTGIKVYKNTSYVDALSKKYMLQFKVFKDTLYTYDSSGRAKQIDVPSASNPVFLDVDGDGFMDILSFNVDLNSVQYYHNTAKSKDSLKFYYTDRCWGKFQENGPHLYTPWNCNEYSTYDPGIHKRSSAHGYSNLCAVDIDGDSDMDLLVGDGGNDSLAMLLNGKFKDGKESKNKRDTIINISFKHNNNNYPTNKPAIIHTMPMASALDVDNDGTGDLIVAAGQPTDTETFHSSRLYNIWYYRNTDTTQNVPVYVLQDSNFLQKTMVDWGVNSAPCFIDVDKDGRKDMIVAVKDGGGKHGQSHMILYLNKPPVKPGGKPFLLYQTDDYIGFSALAKPIKRPVPTGYRNGSDKKTDLLIGNDSGHIMYFKDRSAGTNTADFKLAQSSLMYLSKGKMIPIDVGYNSSPTTADINKDGMTDMLIGANNGTIGYYRCLGYGPGPDFVPYFQLVTNTFGGINATPGSNYQSAPCVTDLNMNGKPDLLVGDKFGNISYYPDFDTVTNLTAATGSLVYDYGAAQRSKGKLFSTWVIPAVANLDNDTIPDIMLGCRRGGLFFLGSVDNGFETIKTGIKEEKISPFNGMKLYPNPARDNIVLEYNNGSAAAHAMLYITDMLGRRHIAHPFMLEPGKGTEPVITSDLPNGIYVVTVVAGDEILTSDKVIINK